MLTPLLVFIAILVLYFLNSVKILREYERGVIFRLGRVRSEPEGPGVIRVFVPLDRIVRRCIRKDPDQRWQNARDVLIELEENSVRPEPLRLDLGLRHQRTLQSLSVPVSALIWWYCICQYEAYLDIPLRSFEKRYCGCNVLVCDRGVLL